MFSLVEAFLEDIEPYLEEIRQRQVLLKEKAQKLKVKADLTPPLQSKHDREVEP